MTWATACFFADALESYLNTNAEFFRPGAPLNFQQDKLDKHLSSCRSLLGLDGIMAMAGLQAVYEFIPYLKENELRFTPGPDDMIKISQNLHELCLKVMAGDDPAKRVFAAFPTYCWID